MTKTTIRAHKYKSKGVKYVKIEIRDDYLRPVYKGIMTEEQYNLMIGGNLAEITQDFTLG